MSVTCRQFKHTIDASPGLQQKLCLRPRFGEVDEDEDCFETPLPLITSKLFQLDTFASFPEIRTAEFDSDPISVININASFVLFDYPNERRVRLPIIGAKCKSMLITQPPLTRMKVFVTCPDHGCFDHVAGDLVSETGLTLGDLYARAKEVLQERFACPFCNDQYERGVRKDDIGLEGYERLDNIAFGSEAPHSYLRDTDTDL